QPNVSQHIKYLEQFYNVKLFEYQNRKLTPTKEGYELKDLAIRLKADSKKIKTYIKDLDPEKEKLNFGATLTIGEYIMPNKNKKLNLNKNNITKKVKNTKKL